MTGGGSSPPPAPSTTTTVQDIPPWEQGYVTNLLGQAQAEAAVPYQQFPGQQVAGFTPDQTQAFSNIENAPSAYSPLQNTAAKSLTSASNAAGGIYGAGSPLVGASALAASPLGIQSYMSPYIGNVVQGIENEANKNWNQNIMPGVNDEFIHAGQFGSGRNAQVLGQAADQFQAGLSANVANALNSGFNEAGSLANSQAGNLLNAGNALGNLAATQSGALTSAGTGASNVASQTAGTNLTQNEALQAVGQQQQQLNQTNLNTAQQNWQNQVQYPEQQTQFLNQIIRGLPAPSSTTSASQTSPLGIYTPSPLAGIGGAATGALSLYGTNGNLLGTAGHKKGGLIKPDDDEPDMSPLQHLSKPKQSPAIYEGEEDMSPLPVAEKDDGEPDMQPHYAEGGEVDPDADQSDPDADQSDPDATPESPLPAPQRPTASAAYPSYGSESPLARGLDAGDSKKSGMTQSPSYGDMSDSDIQKYQLLAMARGMLSPTRTGSPWESLGNAIGGASDTGLEMQKWQQQQRQLAFQREMEIQKLGLQKEQIEQGRYQPIKDVFGNVTGALEGKTGKVMPLSVPQQNGNAAGGQGMLYDSLSPGMRREVDGILAGTIMPPSPSSRAPGAQALLAAAAEKDPSFDAVNYNARAKTRQSFTSGKDADNITALNTAIPHIVKLKQAFDTLGNSDYPMWNTIKNAAGNAFGNKEIQANTAAVSTDATATAHELAKVFRNSGMSEGEIKDWQDKISTSAAPASSGQVINSALDLIDGRLQALGDKYNQGMGTTKNGIELLSPSSRKAYDQLRGLTEKSEGASAAPNSAPSTQGAGTQKIASQDDIAAAAKKTGKSIEQVTQDAKAKGYTIQ